MKKFAIIGSCVSRDIFNDVRMQGLCEVDFYSFQNNVWDMVNEPLNVPAKIINSLPFENFIRRMVDYDLNKTAIKNFNPNNIIIHYPLFCEKYYNIDGEIIGYTK